MRWDEDVIELIKKRKSVRTYAPRTVEPEKLAMFEAFLASAGDNPFGAKVRLEMLGDTAGRKAGTYGLIRGVRLMFGGCVKKGGRDLEGYGYAFEKAVLFATSQGLGTCWLGTFRRGQAAGALGPEDEYLPTVSPIGYAADKPSLAEKITVSAAGGLKRKAFGELFFDGDFSTPLALEDGALKTCLEMVRIGPSASNKQPWRVVRQGDKCHFYRQTDKRYAGNTLFGFCIQRIDLGIAACHFELAARQTGLAGSIVFEDPDLLTAGQAEQGFGYSFTWR